MEKKDELLKHIDSLCRLDIDAIHAYDHAIKKIDVDEPRQRLEEFKRDHERHVQNLSEIIRNLGGRPPEFKPDFKGYMIQGFTALRSVTGTEGALKAMKSNEETTNAKYEQALSWDLPQDIRNVIEGNREDERRHLDYVIQAIDRRVWEGAGKAA